MVIPKTVTRIERRAFMECTSLCALDLPETVVEVADSAYRGCFSLVSVTIRAKSLNQIQFGNNFFQEFPSVSLLRMYPWFFPKLFQSMDDDPTFLFQFFRNYHE